MRSIPQSFYHSRAWLACRNSYLQQHPLCEDCLARGKYEVAVHVHHIIWLTPENYTDPEVSLNHKNLKAVCIECHNREHAKGRQRRWRVSEDGSVQALTGSEG